MDVCNKTSHCRTMSASKVFHQPLKDAKIKFVPVYTYSVRKKHGRFLRSELLQIMCHLAKCEFVFSTLFFVYGLVRPWYATVKLYADMCTVSTVAGTTGVLTSLLGFAALCKFRWKCLMVVYLILSILSSVAYLLVLIFTGIWLGDLEKLTNPFKFMIHFSILQLLSSVAIGVCFILTSAFICNFWSPRDSGKRYKLMGNVQSLISQEQLDSSLVEQIFDDI